MLGMISRTKFFRWGFFGILLFALVVLALSPVVSTLAATPPALQYFYLTLPEDQYMQFMDENFSAAINDPVRSITSIAIGTTGTVVYYDQWEDGGYEVDISNPGSNTYHASTNPDGTQIWGDGVLENGCVPILNNTINPCASPDDDLMTRGQTITLDNNVIVNGTLGSYSRNAAQVFYDGRDKVAATLPVAISRALWPADPGSFVADAQGVLPTRRWGNSYVSPVGENIASAGQSYEDVRWLVMAGPGGATVSLDADANGNYTGGNDLNNVSMAEGQVIFVNGIQTGANLTSSNPVQVTLLTTDINSGWENRFYNLIPRTDWVTDYYTPVGTGTDTACTNLWVYNPNAAPNLVVNYSLGNGTTGTLTIPPRGGTNTGALGSVNIPSGFGARFYTTDGRAFLPISMTDCTNSTSGDIYDWGNELYPVDQLSPEILVGWAPGCTDTSYEGVCLDATNTARTDSRTVLWLTPLANTTIYVDTDGSGISCAAGNVGAGAEKTIPATALNSYQVNDNPTSGTRYYVHDNFGSQAYNREDTTPNTYTNVSAAQNWDTNWTETGDGGGVANAGMIRINLANVGTQTNVLQFRDNGNTNETNVSIQRGRNLAVRGYSRLSFRAQFGGTFNADDGLAVEISSNGGTTWTTLEVLEGPMTFATGQFANKVYRTSAYNSTNTTIRFRMVGNLEAGDTWSIDEVHIDDTFNGDFDMTGSYIRTCDDTLLAAAFGQNPALSFNSDDEAMDLGMGVPPYGSQIRITKAADRSFASPGELVTYNYTVRLIQTFSTAVNNVEVVDDRCSPVSYSSGDNSNGYLDPGETWNFTCTGVMYADTTNYAVALAHYGTDRIRSNPAYDTVRMTSSAGDYVWVDEDGDGDQDAGEPGIPNARVTLIGTDSDGNPVNLTTYTDADGRYLFTDVPPSNVGGYTITVDSSSLPAGLAANPTYDENGVGTPHAATIVLGSDVEYTTADFGYNWASTTDSNNNTGTGMIGDHVWSDADGDGLQDPGEPGLYGVSVELLTAGPDGLFGTADDLVAATTTTDYTGNYAFDGLAAGAYAVRIATPPAGYAQTGDPDQHGLPCTACDARTTTPILLAPGDVYLNADFGYQPDANTGATIGDTLWVDTDRNNTLDAGEPRLPGVTVSLIRDLNGNGIWDVGEPIIATDITDASGQYQFNGVPMADGLGTDDYLVWVNDTANVLDELNPTYDGDGTATPNISAVPDLGLAGDSDQDFAYAPAGHDSTEALVGDTIWFDLNGNGSFDPGEGLEGVIVNLFQDTDGDGIFEFGEPFLGRTITNENGQYFFGGLAADIYTVDIDLNTLPNYGTTLTNFSDPDGGTPHRAVFTLASGEIRLDQDFGYRSSAGHAIGGTLWNDTDADGSLEGGESGRYAGVTVALYSDSNDNGIWDAADELVGTQTTDANGNYNFTGLPDDRYFVDVTDHANLLNGAWHSLGTNPGADNNSQSDYYTVDLAGADNLTGDFGYYRDPASLGNFVWDDTNRDNLQTSGELGIPDVTVELTINWPDGSTTVLTTLTDASGYYTFGNLLLDEDFDGSGAGEPTFSLTFTPPATYTPVTADAGDDALDSDGSTNVPATITQGAYNDTLDSGFKQVVMIGDRLWLDLDGDGQQDAGEPGISGVDIFIDLNDNGVYDAGDLLDTTDANGNYSFDDLPIGVYRVIVNAATLPGGLIQTGDPDSSFDHEHTLTANLPGTYDGVDFGYQGTGSIGDFVWNDLNGDGVQDAGEGGIGGVTVSLYDAIGINLLATTTTDANGNYSFEGLPYGDYTVQVTQPAGTTQTGDPDGARDNTSVVTLNSTTPDVDTADFGYQSAALSISKTSSAGGSTNLGDTIDYTIVVRNNTGATHTNIVVNDALPVGTTYMPTSSQKTYPSSGTGTFSHDMGTATFNGTGTFIQSYDTTGQIPVGVTLVDYAFTVTGEAIAPSWLSEIGLVAIYPSGTAYTLNSGTFGTTNPGTYSETRGPGTFNGSAEGVYEFHWTESYDDGGAGLNDNRIDSATFSITYGVSGLTTDAAGDPPNLVSTSDGINLLPGQSMTVTFQVTVNNPVPAGLASIDNTASVTSDQQLIPQEDSTSDTLHFSIGDRVWSDYNADGFQVGEPGIQGFTVELYDSGNNLIATTTTDSNGDYLFDDLASGVYTVVVTPSGGWRPTYDEDSGTSPDSQTIVTLGTVVDHDTADFGYQPALAVGGTLWDDSGNNDGSTVGDPGIANVSVQLITAGVDGIFGTADDVVAATTTTDANGNYLFNGLDAGEYVVSVPTWPTGFARSVLGNPDPDNNTDHDDNGGPLGGGVQSLAVTLEPLDGSYHGQEPDTAADGDINRSNLTVDFGFTNDPNAVNLVGFSARSLDLRWLVTLLAGALILGAGLFFVLASKQKAAIKVQRDER